jgi:glycerophosphoryl diester phosphodiesterase
MHQAENSMAFRAAIDAGYGIELDIQPSRDGIRWCFTTMILGG